MKSKFMGFLLLCCFVTSCALSSKPPLPEALKIIPPSPDVSSELSAFIGIWEGKWGASQDTIIVIEKIDNQKAEIILSNGKLGVGGFGFISENSYQYITANVQPDKTLEWLDVTQPNPDTPHLYQCPCKVTFRLNKELDKLIVFQEYTKYNTKLRADLTRKK